MENPFSTLEKKFDERFELLNDKIDKLLQVSKPEKRYTVKEFATLTDSTPQTIRAWIKEGKITAKRIGRKLFIEESQFKNGLTEVKSLKFKR